jgi:cytochrome c5
MTAEQVYNTACAACHEAGIAGAPKMGDAAAWAPRIEQGMDTLATHAIKGFQGSAGYMPPKGGRPDLSDDAVRAAVQHMVDASQ